MSCCVKGWAGEKGNLKINAIGEALSSQKSGLNRMKILKKTYSCLKPHIQSSGEGIFLKDNKEDLATTKR